MVEAPRVHTIPDPSESGDDSSERQAQDSGKGSKTQGAIRYVAQGLCREAEGLFKRVMSARQNALGDEHPATLASMAELASTYWKQGQWSDAEDRQLELMQAQSKIWGDNHPSTLSSIVNLASTYGNQGRWREAEELFDKVLVARSRVLGDEHSDTMAVTANLAMTTLYERACAGYQRRLGDSRPTTVARLDDFQDLLSTLHDLEREEA